MKEKFGSVFKQKWRLILALFLAVWAIESFSYFVVATWSGAVHGGAAHALNLQLPIDRIIPWFTPIFALYMPLPFIWIVLFPWLAWLAGGQRLFFRYFVISLMMYVVGTGIYAVMPTVTIPHDFLAGPIQTLPKDSLFYQSIAQLDSSSVNVFGSFPSYHNTWAALSVAFGLVGLKHNRPVIGWVCVALGLAITVSTLVLHQHALLDAVFTYLMVAGCWWLDEKGHWSKYLTER
jgi:hypothetical protein